MKLKHLAIIADGNGRWADARGLPREEGHVAGRNKIEELMYHCVSLEIPILSVFCFSTENWNRPEAEVQELFQRANEVFDQRYKFKSNNVKVIGTGSLDRLPEETVQRFRAVREETKDCDGLILNIVANYGGREEIVRACKEAVASGEEISEEAISRHLYSPELPPPDVILRTGGYQRLSGFLLWECPYTELYFTDTLFPDLGYQELQKVKVWFEGIKRNFGGLDDGNTHQ